MNGSSGLRRAGTGATTSRLGMVLAGSAAVVSGLAVWLNAQVVTRVEVVSDPGTYTTAKNLVAAVAILAVAGLSAGRRSPAALTRPGTRGQWVGLLLVSIVGGSVPFLLFFEGLASSGSPVDAQAVHKASLLVFVVVLGPSLLRERLGPLQGAGMVLVVVGYLLMGDDFGAADAGGLILVGLAAALWALESVIDRWLLSDLSVTTVATARLGVGVVWLLLIGMFTGDTGRLGQLGATGWMWVALTGLVLAAYVACWLGALAEAQAVDVTAVLALAVPITAVLNSVMEDAPLPSPRVLAVIVVGVVAVAAASWNSRPRLDPVWGRV